jgi:hypothetical protein
MFFYLLLALVVIILIINLSNSKTQENFAHGGGGGSGSHGGSVGSSHSGFGSRGFESRGLGPNPSGGLERVLAQDANREPSPSLNPSLNPSPNLNPGSMNTSAVNKPPTLLTNILDSQNQEPKLGSGPNRELEVRSKARDENKRREIRGTERSPIPEARMESETESQYMPMTMPTPTPEISPYLKPKLSPLPPLPPISPNINEKIKNIVKESALLSISSLDNKENPINALKSANYSFGYLSALREIYSDEQIQSATNIDIDKYKDELLKIQAQSVSNITTRCSKLANDKEYLLKVIAQM